MDLIQYFGFNFFNQILSLVNGEGIFKVNRQQDHEFVISHDHGLQAVHMFDLPEGMKDRFHAVPVFPRNTFTNDQRLHFNNKNNGYEQKKSTHHNTANCIEHRVQLPGKESGDHHDN